MCLSCLESNDLPSFPWSNIHNRHVKYVTVYNQLKCNTTKNKGGQWLSGRVLDSRPRGPRFEPYLRHCVVVIEQDTFILA